VLVIAEMLGVPGEDSQQLKRWSTDIARFLGSVRGVKAALAAHSEMCAYIRALIDRRRGSPGEDLLSALITAEDEGAKLSELEILATCQLLLIAGHETTTHLIGNGLLALLRHPEQLDALRARPELTQSAVEELLRFDGPIQVISRQALEDLEIDGRPVKKGQYLNLMLAAANRDPAQFDEPHRLDLGRHENRHVAFASGIHYCLGAPLARLESTIAFGQIARRFPKLQLTDATLQWQDNVGVRGLTSLPLTF
jgi:cytochrome P450